jgi:GAF domain-containing protein
MSEPFNDLVLPESPEDRYAVIEEQLRAVLSDEPEPVARLATAVSMLKEAFSPRFFWVGFYLVDPHREEELVVGPYQGSLGCLRISFARGVCGAAARSRQTQLVADVHQFPGHIACDARSQSEIVVPLIDPRGRLLGVLDVDSGQPAAFDATDQAALERICTFLAGSGRWPGNGN